jgi:hypothetical protein
VETWFFDFFWEKNMERLKEYSVSIMGLKVRAGFSLGEIDIR